MSSITQPRIQSHDQSEALGQSSLGPPPTPHIYCILLAVLSPSLARLVCLRAARTILQCAFGPRCGRAAPSVSEPANNAPTEEVQEGSEEFSLWLHPTPVPDLCPPINISSIWQTHQNATGVSPLLSNKHNGAAVFASNKDRGVKRNWTGPPDLNTLFRPTIRGSM